MNSAKYGLKVFSKYNLSDYKTFDLSYEKDIQNSNHVESLEIKESGVYRIKSKSSLSIKHNLNLDLVHIYVVLEGDDVMLNINVKDKVASGHFADVYHHVSNVGDNNKVNVNLDVAVMKDASLIYRSMISNDGAKMLTGSSVSKILNLSDSDKVIVEPSVRGIGALTHINHETQIRNIGSYACEYMNIYGLDKNDIEEMMLMSYNK